MKKRILALFLAVIMTATLLPATAQAAESDFVINKNGVLTEYDGPGGDVVIPDGVIQLGESPGFLPSHPSGAYPFAGCTTLTSITIPDSLTSLYTKYQFDDCTALTDFVVSEGNLEYSSKDGALFNKDKTTLIRYPIGRGGVYTVPDSVTELGWSGAFLGCSRLTDVVLGSGLTTIAADTFYRCTGLRSVTIPDSIVEIKDGAFLYCSSLATITIPDHVTRIGRGAFEGCGLTSITIPSGVEEIDSEAFCDCEELTSVHILDNSSVELGMHVFSGCKNLTSVTIPVNVTKIGDYAFHTMNINSGKYEPIAGLTIYGVAGSYAETYARKNSIPFVPLTGHQGTLTGENGEEIKWSVSSTGRVAITSPLTQGEAVLVGCYDDQGRFVGVKWMDADHASTQIDPTTPNVKLFWLGANANPLSPSATVWGK